MVPDLYKSMVSVVVSSGEPVSNLRIEKEQEQEMQGTCSVHCPREKPDFQEQRGNDLAK